MIISFITITGAEAPPLCLSMNSRTLSEDITRVENFSQSLLGQTGKENRLVMVNW